MFANRQEAGQRLAQKLKKIVKEKDLVIVSLVRGGVVLGKIISDKLKCPHQILVVKKIGYFANQELAIGAIAPKNTLYWNEELCGEFNLTRKQKELLKKQKEKERKKQEKELVGGGKAFDFKDKLVILVDDGVATGATVIAAAEYLQKQKTKGVILATPVIAKDTLFNIKKYFDTVIALKIKEHFFAVGQFYKDFPQVENKEVKNLLK